MLCHVSVILSTIGVCVGGFDLGLGVWSGGPGVWSEREADPPPPRDGYCRGWYASYWNVFLFARSSPIKFLTKKAEEIATEFFIQDLR